MTFWRLVTSSYDTGQIFGFVKVSVWTFHNSTIKLLIQNSRRATFLLHAFLICSPLFNLSLTIYHCVWEPPSNHTNYLLEQESTWQCLMLIKVLWDFKIRFKTSIKQIQLHSTTSFSISLIRYTPSLFANESMFHRFEVETLRYVGQKASACKLQSQTISIFSWSFPDNKLELRTEFQKACKINVSKVSVPSMFKFNTSSDNCNELSGGDLDNLLCHRTRHKISPVLPRPFTLPHSNCF